MILVDTSVWIDHFRRENGTLVACGSLTNRAELLEMLKWLPTPPETTHDEALHFIDEFKPN